LVNVSSAGNLDLIKKLIDVQVVDIQAIKISQVRTSGI
jgi:hypothetical protein